MQPRPVRLSPREPLGGCPHCFPRWVSLRAGHRASIQAPRGLLILCVCVGRDKRSLAESQSIWAKDVVSSGLRSCPAGSRRGDLCLELAVVPHPQTPVIPLPCRELKYTDGFSLQDCKTLTGRVPLGRHRDPKARGEPQDLLRAQVATVS